VKRRVENIICRACLQPLNGSRVVIACKGNEFGSIIIIECSNCGYLNAFRVENGA